MSSTFIDLTGDSTEGESPEETRRSKKRSSPERRSASVPGEPAPDRSVTQPGGVADPDGDAKQRIMRMAARVNATKMPALAVMAASTAVGNASVGRVAAAAQAPAPAESRGAAAGPSSATAQCSNSWLRDLHQDRILRHGPPAAVVPSAPALSAAEPLPTLAVLTWNLWFAEEVMLETRMGGVRDIVQGLGLPHVLCFQEMTHNILALLSATCPWWRRYSWNRPSSSCPYFTMLGVLSDAGLEVVDDFREHFFSNSQMGRSILSAGLCVGGRRFLVATSHLESPLGNSPDSQMVKPRWEQLTEGITMLSAAGYRNVLWAGDFNFTARDPPLKLKDSWRDVWADLKPGDAGLTYDGKTNAMLGPRNNIRARVDRCLVRMVDWAPADVELVGMQPLGPQWQKTLKRGVVRMETLPSDHYGIYSSFEPVA